MDVELPFPLSRDCVNKCVITPGLFHNTAEQALKKAQPADTLYETVFLVFYFLLKFQQKTPSRLTARTEFFVDINLFKDIP